MIMKLTILISEPKHDIETSDDADDEKYGSDTWWTTRYSNDNTG